MLITDDTDAESVSLDGILPPLTLLKRVDYRQNKWLLRFTQHNTAQHYTKSLLSTQQDVHKGDHPSSCQLPAYIHEPSCQ